MISKSKSSSRARLKYLFVLPLAAFSIAALAHPEVPREPEDVTQKRVVTVIKQNYSPDSCKKDSIVVVGYGTHKKDHPLVIIDGVEMEHFDPQNIDPNTIESIAIIKDASATKEYGEKGKNGVISIIKKTDKDGEYSLNRLFEQLRLEVDSLKEEVEELKRGR
ncbi:MAG: TonB-dependent receptor plug domain-containing protein [Tannerellaceae bacterium]|jgi:hypothetical protein|nr:TonB-dependent receptor plug domain-containing protein [Tannerellaceae bacterium]